MATFKDTTGREWEIKVHLGTIERARDDTGVNILEWGMHHKDDDPTETLLFRLRGDPILLANIVWAIVRDKEATEDARDAFMEALSGDALWDARVALEDAIVNFTRGPEKARLTKVRETLAKIMDEILAETNRRIADPRLDKALNSVLAKQKETFGDWLDSLESVPMDAPSDS